MSDISTKTGESQAPEIMWVFLGVIAVICLLFAGITSCVFFSSLQMDRTKPATTDTEITATPSRILLPTRTQDPNFILETFDDNANGWSIDSFDDDFIRGKTSIKNGLYVWEISETKQSCISRANVSNDNFIMEDFDVTIDAELVAGPQSDMCYGLQFRASTVRQVNDYYTYTVCDNGYFAVAFFDGGLKSWDTLLDWTPTNSIHPYEWNTLGVSARGNHFTFTINDQQVAALDDTRSQSGKVSMLINVVEGATGIIWYDNFELQRK